MAVAGAMFMVLLTLSTTVASSSNSVYGCYKSIISFGDSLADTGNILAPSLQLRPPSAACPPYGRTFFHHPSGRTCDGRLIIDFIAQSLGLPLLKPYVSQENEEARRRSFRTGVNFAVSGATALEYDFYKKIGLFQNPATMVSLRTQLDWFRSFLATVPDGKEYLEKALVVMGEIGGNDYNYPIMQGKTLDEVGPLVPAVINYMGFTIQELIKLGVVTILVPGNFPIGCLPIYLTQYEKSSTHNDYDPRTGCLDWLNEFSRYHNELLLKELQRIRELHPLVNIIYADYYSAAMELYLSPNQFGFGSTAQILRACCGGGGTYNYNSSASCGRAQLICCDDPTLYANWDGLHFTEAAYRLIAQGLLQGHFTHPHFSTICPDSLSKPHDYYEY